MKNHCQCDACKDGVIHSSDCAVHNEPAYPKGECDCFMKDMKDCASCRKRIEAEYKEKFNLIVICPTCGAEFNELNIPLVEQITRAVEKAFISYWGKLRPEEVTEAVKNFKKQVAQEIFEKIEDNWGWYTGKWNEKDNCPDEDAIMTIRYGKWQAFWEKYGL